MIIAIDGPAGSGKSTLAQALASKLNFAYLDTGAMYRCVALSALKNSVSLNDSVALGDIAHTIHINFKNEEGKNQVYIGETCVTADIRTPQIDNAVSAVASDPKVRTAMSKLQREFAAQSDVVCEGRDMGTVVFPNAEIKIFLSADPKARAARRFAQQSQAQGDGDTESIKEKEAEVLKGLLKRDELDSSRETAPLKPAEDAVHMDSTNMTIEEEVAFICNLIDEYKKSQAAGTDANTEETHSTQESSSTPSKKKLMAPKQKLKAIKSKRKPKPRPGSTPMKIFGNSHKDYMDHKVADYPLHARIVHGVACTVVGGFVKLFWPWKFTDMENFTDVAKKQGVVVIMNHVSNLDPVIPIISAYFKGVTLRPIYKSEFAENPVLRWFFMRGGGIPVHRHTADLTAIRTAQRALENGESILIFPEGTRVKEGEESVIHKGFALMAQLAGADVVPMAIVGARDVTPRGKKIPRPGRIFLKVGKPLVFKELHSTKRKDQLEEIETKSVERVFEMVEELRAEHPGKM